MTLLALPFGNDVIDDIHFAWQVQYLVRFQVDFFLPLRLKKDTAS